MFLFSTNHSLIYPFISLVREGMCGVHIMKNVKVIIRTLTFIFDEMESQLSSLTKFTF